MRFVDETLCDFAIHAGDVSRQRDLDTEAGWDLADAHVAGDGGGCWQGDFGGAGDVFQRAEEASAVARCEQLLRIGAWQPVAAELFWRGQFCVEDTGRRTGRAFTATRGCGFGALENFFDGHRDFLG